VLIGVRIPAIRELLGKGKQSPSSSILQCQQCTQKIFRIESMQRDIRQENRMNTLTISEVQKIYLSKVFKKYTVEF
jgi:hypothetical protein